MKAIFWMIVGAVLTLMIFLWLTSKNPQSTAVETAYQQPAADSLTDGEVLLDSAQSNRPPADEPTRSGGVDGDRKETASPGGETSLWGQDSPKPAPLSDKAVMLDKGQAPHQNSEVEMQQQREKELRQTISNYDFILRGEKRKQ